MDEINRAGVRIARVAQDRCDRDVLVAGSVSPAVTALQRRRVGAAERMEVIREQVEALLADDGVDILILETFGYLEAPGKRNRSRKGTADANTHEAFRKAGRTDRSSCHAGFRCGQFYDGPMHHGGWRIYGKRGERMSRRTCLSWIAMLSLGGSLPAETGYNAWLRYAPVDHLDVPAVVSVLDDSVLAGSAQAELIRGFRGMTGKILRAEHGVPAESAIVVGTLEEIRKVAPQWKLDAKVGPEGFWLKTVTAGAVHYTVIAGADERGALYGAFALLRKAAAGEPLVNLDDRETPAVPVRWVNEWDNLDGTIERGYGGRSIFWDGLHARADLSRVSDYGRMLASLGIQRVLHQ